MIFASTQTKFDDLCTPAQIYVVTSLLGIVIYIMNMNILKHLLTSTISIVIHILFMLVWTYGLNILCKYKIGKVLAWFIALIPIILIVMSGLVFVYIINKLDINQLGQHRLLKQGNLWVNNDDDDIEGLNNSCNN
jgi:hypothetical protein